MQTNLEGCLIIKVSHEDAVVATSQSAMDRLMNFFTQRRGSTELVRDMENFERELHGYFVEAEREVLLGRFDVDLPAVRIEGDLYRQVVAVRGDLCERGGSGACATEFVGTMSTGVTGGDIRRALNATGARQRVLWWPYDAAGRGGFVA